MLNGVTQQAILCLLYLLCTFGVVSYIIAQPLLFTRAYSAHYTKRLYCIFKSMCYNIYICKYRCWKAISWLYLPSTIGVVFYTMGQLLLP